MKFRRMAVVSNQAFSIVNFRRELIKDIVSSGVMVFAFAPDYNDELVRAVKEIGAIPVSVEMDRVGVNPIQAIRTVLGLVRAIRDLEIDAVLSYFTKPVIYGGLAARFSGVDSIYSFIEGAGYVYADGVGSTRRVILRKFISFLYRLSLSFSSRVFLLNRDDYSLFVGGGLVRAEKAILLPGIGLDLDRFKEQTPVVSPVVFTFLGRLLREKGVIDFVSAARIIKNKHPEVVFLIVGDVDVNPGSIGIEDLKAWGEEGLVTWVGHVADVRPWLAETSVLVHPSYYREGIPRSIQEAMASGRPVITTDSVGCRESIEDPVNGFLVPIRSPESIARAMERFIAEPELIVEMGRQSRRLAELRFDVREINEMVMAVF